jgi:hypothetical protein
MKTSILPIIYFFFSQIGYSQTQFEQLNGRYNKAITIFINEKPAELKPISCGLLHIKRKNKTTGEIENSDQIMAMFLDKYDGSFILNVNFKDMKASIGNFPYAGKKRPLMEYDKTLPEGHPNKYVFPRQHVGINFYPNKKNEENPYNGSFYISEFDQGEVAITRLDMPNHRISFVYNGTIKPQWGKGEALVIKNLEIKDMPLAEMDANDMAMPTKIIFQEKF